MIIDKSGSSLRRLKLFFFILLLVSVAVVFFSCKYEDNNNGDTYNSILSQWRDSEQSSGVIEKSNQNIDKYIVVISSEYSGEVYDSAIELCELITEKTNIEVKLVYSHEKYSATKNSREIIIGVSSKSEAVLSEYKLMDYGYFSNDGVIYIGGRTDETILSAITKFKQDVVDSSQLDVFIEENLNCFYTSEYDIDKVILNGFELCDYTIVYPKGDASAEKTVNELYRVICERTGYCLSVKNDKEVAEQTRAISVGDTSLCDGIATCDENEFRITSYHVGVSLTYSGEYAMKMGLNRLLSLLLDKDTEGDVVVDISSEISQKFISEKLLTDSFYLTDPILAYHEILEIYNTIYNENADIVRIVGISKKSADYISANLGEKYAFIHSGTDDVGTYHFYKKSKFTADTEYLDTNDNSNILKVAYTSLGSGIDFYLLEGDCASLVDSFDDIMGVAEHGRFFVNIPISNDEIYEELDLNGEAGIISLGDSEASTSYVYASGYDCSVKSSSELLSKNFCDGFGFVLEIYKSE